jgi:Polyprenyl synthetase
MALPSFDVPNSSWLERSVLECMARVPRRLDDPRLDADLRAKLVAYWGAIEAAHEARRRAGRVAGALPAWSSSVAGLFLMVVASENAAIDDSILEAATGCELYVLSVSLFDAIQDGELEGPLGDLPIPVMINTALIMFVQACEAILQLCDSLSPALQRRLRESFIARSMILGRGQHRDLRCVQPASLELAVVQAQDKTEAIPMTAELAALAAGCEPARVELYTRIGRRSALLRQCGNDLADLYGKSKSLDLETGKWTLPTIAYFSAADETQREELLRLREELPGSLDRIRRLVFDSGAVRQLAFVMERARREIHSAIHALGRSDSPIAMVGAHADLTAARLYSPLGAR